MVVQTLLSTMLHLMPRRLLTGAQCLPFNSILRPETFLSLTMALHCLMVRHYLINNALSLMYLSYLIRNGVKYRQ